jgi:hypothetical protein
MADWLATPENCKVCEGSAAKHAIAARLASCPQALSLALRVSDFYGDSLVYRESTRFSSSFYQIQFSSDQTELQFARIDLQLGTNRTTEAVCHELLHLDMAIRGYPLPVETFVPRELVPYAPRLLGIQAIASNLLGHEINFHQFLKLGLEGEKFLADPSRRPAYEALALVQSKLPEYTEATEYPCWCLSYLSNWLSCRHGGKSGITDEASASLLLGSRIYPQIKEYALDMTALIESGFPNDASGYPLFYNTLMWLMRLPQCTKWVVLGKGYRKPSVRRVSDHVVFPKG